MKVELYIAGRKVDLSDDELILFNYTQEDLDNPTYLKNSYSQTLTLAGTPNNNAIFGDLFRVDRETLISGGGEMDGAYFNATRKTPFQLFSVAGDELSSGYVKIDTIERESGSIAYKISLYGGLGSFFYDMSYDENGDELSLADLEYHDKTDTAIDLDNTTLDITAANIYDIWQELMGSTSTFDWVNVLNFAPCNNGVPKDFDAKKAIIGFTQFYNIPYVSGDFSWNSTAQGILVNMENDHDEWEMRDLRAYLQRPVVSVKEILLAIQRTTTYTLVYDSDWFDASNPRYEDVWLTLPIYKSEDGDYTGVPLAELLKGTMTPAAFLISYARTFGLVFKVDGDTITVMKRSTYYAEYRNDLLDLSGRIDVESVQQKPFAFDAKWYSFSNTVEGAFASYYKDKYGRDYGEQRVNTGYEFDNSVKELTDGLAFRGAVQARESSPLFRLIGKSGLQNFAPAYSEKITIRLYDNVNNQSSDVEPLDTSYDNPDVVYNNTTYPFSDFQDRPQFHDGDGKAQDGSGVLLFFVGTTAVPSQSTFLSGFSYHLSDDDATALDALNDGKPCWDIRGGFPHIQPLTELPHFSRWHNELSMDFGVPSEIAVVGDLILHNGIYTQRWDRYIADRYDDDSRVMTCKVNLRGWRVGQELLQRFYWWKGAVWSLNKIINHSITTNDLTDCEFVKVQSVANYAVDSLIYYLNITPLSLRFQNNLTTTIEIQSNDDWTIDDAPAWLTIDQMSGTGDATLTVTASATSADRSGQIEISGANVATQYIAVDQLVPVVHTITATPNTLTWANGDTTTYEVLVETTASNWQVLSSPAWVSVTGSGDTLYVTNLQTATTLQQGNIVIETIGLDEDISATIACTKQAGVVWTASFSSGVPISAFSASGGTRYISVASNDTWTITATPTIPDDNLLWLSISPNSGSGNQSGIRVRASVNNDGVVRGATLTLTGYHGQTATATVTQNTVAKTISVSPSSLIVSAKASTQTVTVTSNDTWMVDIPAEVQSWVSVDTASGSGNATLTFSISAYTNIYISREAVVSIIGDNSTTVTVSITQNPKVVYVLTTNPANGWDNINVLGGIRTLQITTNGTWTITSYPAWCSISADNLSGGTDGETTITDVPVTVSENDSGDARSGSLVITWEGDTPTTKTLTLSQNDVSYDLSVDKNIINISATGGSTDTFTITANQAWTITCPAWASVNTAIGSGNATITVTVVANTGVARTGYIAVTGQQQGYKNIQLTQASGILLYFDNNDAGNPAVFVGDNATLDLICNDPLDWELEVPLLYQPYIDIISSMTGNGNATVTVRRLQAFPPDIDVMYIEASSPNASITSGYVAETI